MIIHYGIEKINIHKPVVTIGSFDGVHLGHLSVIRCLKDCAGRIGGESVIITFEPHPREVLYPEEKKPGILTTLEEKIAILEADGIQHLIILPFTRELGGLSYDDFVKQLLIDKIGMAGLVIGYDHRFGKDRTGNYESLLHLSEQFHFFLEKLPVFEANDVNISSTKIRNALAIGDITCVNAFLGYRYSLTGEVIEGKKLGRSIGFPTANLQLPDERKLLPALGVYAVSVYVGGIQYHGLLNIGIRPTVSTAGTLSLEVHLFDFTGNLYGETLTVSLIERLRGERKFDDINELKLQLEKDKLTALSRL